MAKVFWFFFSKKNIFSSFALHAQHTALMLANPSQAGIYYAAAQDTSSETALLLGGEWLTRVSDATVDVRIGKPDAHAIAMTLARFLLASQQIATAQQELEVLVETGHAPAVSQAK